MMPVHELTPWAYFNLTFLSDGAPVLDLFKFFDFSPRPTHTASLTFSNFLISAPPTIVTAPCIEPFQIFGAREGSYKSL
jgi:hypothetical protein